jgi:hypothetical protein
MSVELCLCLTLYVHVIVTVVTFDFIYFFSLCDWHASPCSGGTDLYFNGVLRFISEVIKNAISM